MIRFTNHCDGGENCCGALRKDASRIFRRASMLLAVFAADPIIRLRQAMETAHVPNEALSHVVNNAPPAVARFLWLRQHVGWTARMAANGTTGDLSMSKPRISYVDPASVDAAMRAEFERCSREGTPRCTR